MEEKKKRPRGRPPGPKKPPKPPSGRPRGRPKKSVEKSWIRIAQECVTYEDIEDIVQKCVEQAKLGDSNARNFLFDRVCGKPNIAPPPQGASSAGKREIVFKLVDGEGQSNAD